jgi:phosphoribosylglycinamide formyltransferase-1
MEGGESAGAPHRSSVSGVASAAGPYRWSATPVSGSVGIGRPGRHSNLGAVRVAVLVSGSGTILEAMLDAGVPVAVVVSDRPCRGLEVAAAAGVPAELVDRREWGGFGGGFDRRGFTGEVTRVLVGHGPDLVAMAGFGTVLDQPVHDAFGGRILNTHPALLPAFPGWHGVEDALAAGVTVTGCTVHLATLEMDAGPILAQQSVSVRPDDTAASLHERIKEVERQLYPATVLAAVDELAATGSLDGLHRPPDPPEDRRREQPEEVRT